MEIDEISEIGIDNKERLYIKPVTKQFFLIYRTATEVHWDQKGLFLYSPKPREWTYFDWYKYIITLAKNECNCKLVWTDRTLWVDITDDLKREIKDWK